MSNLRVLGLVLVLAASAALSVFGVNYYLKGKLDESGRKCEDGKCVVLPADDASKCGKGCEHKCCKCCECNVDDGKCERGEDGCGCCCCCDCSKCCCHKKEASVNNVGVVEKQRQEGFISNLVNYSVRVVDRSVNVALEVTGNVVEGVRKVIEG